MTHKFRSSHLHVLEGGRERGTGYSGLCFSRRQSMCVMSTRPLWPSLKFSHFGVSRLTRRLLYLFAPHCRRPTRCSRRPHSSDKMPNIPQALKNTKEGRRRGTDGFQLKGERDGLTDWLSSAGEGEEGGERKRRRMEERRRRRRCPLWESGESNNVA